MSDAALFATRTRPSVIPGFGRAGGVGPAGVGSVAADGRLMLPRAQWSQIVVRAVMEDAFNQSVGGQLSDFDGQSLPHADTSFGPAGRMAVQRGATGAVAAARGGFIASGSATPASMPSWPRSCIGG